MNDEERKEKFKIALIKSGMNMKEFCLNFGINYSVFNQAINGFTSMKEEFTRVVDKFISQFN